MAGNEIIKKATSEAPVSEQSVKMCLINGSLDLDMLISMCLWNCPNGWRLLKTEMELQPSL